MWLTVFTAGAFLNFLRTDLQKNSKKFAGFQKEIDQRCEAVVKNPENKPFFFRF